MTCNSRLFPENIFGHKKKVIYIKNQINRYLAIYGPPVTVLDFGCGNGSAVSQFLIGDDTRYFGVDIHPQSIQYAAEHFGDRYAAFLDHVPTSKQFDIIVYADILEHAPDPGQLLKQHFNLLKEHGIIIGSVPNGRGPFEMEKRAFAAIERFLERRWARHAAIHGVIPYNGESGHIQFFKRDELFSMLYDSAFEVTDFSNGSFIGGPVSAFFVLRGTAIARINAKIADRLPYWAVSTWYFTARKRR